MTQSNYSRLQTLAIAEYQARRVAHQIAQQIVVSETSASSAGVPAGAAPVGVPSPFGDFVLAVGG